MLAALLAVALAARPSSSHWSALATYKCPRCENADSKRLMSNNVRLPENGLVYFFAGEFAKDPKLWLLDLDTGNVTRCESDNESTCKPDGTIAHDALGRLRDAALAAWQRKWSRTPPSFAPGAVDDCYIVSRHRRVSFSPLESKDKLLSDEVEQIIFRPDLKR